MEPAKVRVALTCESSVSCSPRRSRPASSTMLSILSISWSTSSLPLGLLGRQRASQRRQKQQQLL